MYVPKINADRNDFNDLLPKDTTDFVKAKNWLRTTIVEAYATLMKKDFNFIKRFDLVSDSPHPQITPLVTFEGVVIRLDFSQCIKPLSFDEPYSDSILSEWKSIIYHELYHLQDRLNPNFRMDYHEDAVKATEKKRRQINAVWDLFIERRKLKEFNIPPIATFSRETSRESEAVSQNFYGIVGENDTSIAIFNEIWESSKYFTYPDILSFAKKLV